MSDPTTPRRQNCYCSQITLEKYSHHTPKHCTHKHCINTYAVADNLDAWYIQSMTSSRRICSVILHGLPGWQRSDWLAWVFFFSLFENKGLCFTISSHWELHWAAPKCLINDISKQHIVAQQLNLPVSWRPSHESAQVPWTCVHSGSLDDLALGSLLLQGGLHFPNSCVYLLWLGWCS